MINYAKIAVEFNKKLRDDSDTFVVTLPGGEELDPAVKITQPNFACSDMAKAIPFVRPTILYEPSAQYYTDGKVVGVFVIDIFTKAGDGMGVGYAIATALDDLLARQSFGENLSEDFGAIQTRTSSINDRGIDTESKEIYRLEYNLPFIHHFNL